MQDISEYFIDYKNVLKELWNKHFIKNGELSQDFKFEIDKAFSLIDIGLFDSLVIAKSFDFSIERSQNGFYSQIIVNPKVNNLKALCAKQCGIMWDWQEINVQSEGNVFNYIELFDWAANEEMKCEFVRTRLTKAKSLSNFIGYDFLFSATEVNYLKIENN